MIRKSIVFLMLFLLTFTVSCIEKQDYGIITGFYVKDSVIHWDDIDDAMYYEIYVDEDFNEDRFTYTFISECSDFLEFKDDVEYNIQIKVYYNNSEPDLSETITFMMESESYVTPNSVGRNYSGDEYTWRCNEKEEYPVLNYTFLINSEEYEVETNSISITDLESGVYKTQVKANYEGGSSDYSIPTYWLVGYSSDVITVDYIVGSGEALEIPFENARDIIAIEDEKNMYHSLVMPDEGIITINDDSITISKEYLELCTNVDFDYLNVVSQFNIYTEDTLYILWIKGAYE
jgi:hypothetical protein